MSSLMPLAALGAAFPSAAVGAGVVEVDVSSLAFAGASFVGSAALSGVVVVVVVVLELVLVLVPVLVLVSVLLVSVFSPVLEQAVKLRIRPSEQVTAKEVPLKEGRGITLTFFTLRSN
jgi:hypothetical protein